MLSQAGTDRYTDFPKPLVQSQESEPNFKICCPLQQDPSVKCSIDRFAQILIDS